jgi:hypothetical protein
MPDAAPRPHGLPPIDGTHYLDVLEALHARLRPAWYLEIGTAQGFSLAKATGDTIAVDPRFALRAPPMKPGMGRLFLFQETSDAFFASGFLARNGIVPGLAFLDGMHLFEYLLRDFIQAEAAMAPDGVILLHDCCPLHKRMALREVQPTGWTGDVWKTLLILLDLRPDLRIDVTTARGTGLVVVSGLNPASRVLADRYDALVGHWRESTLDTLPGGLAGYYARLDLVSPEAALERLPPRG